MHDPRRAAAATPSPHPHELTSLPLLRAATIRPMNPSPKDPERPPTAVLTAREWSLILSHHVPLPPPPPLPLPPSLPHPPLLLPPPSCLAAPVVRWPIRRGWGRGRSANRRAEPHRASGGRARRLPKAWKFFRRTCAVLMLGDGLHRTTLAKDRVKA